MASTSLHADATLISSCKGGLLRFLLADGAGPGFYARPTCWLFCAAWFVVSCRWFLVLRAGIRKRLQGKQLSVLCLSSFFFFSSRRGEWREEDGDRCVAPPANRIVSVSHRCKSFSLSHLAFSYHYACFSLGRSSPPYHLAPSSISLWLFQDLLLKNKNNQHNTKTQRKKQLKTHKNWNDDDGTSLPFSIDPYTSPTLPAALSPLIPHHHNHISLH
jgi:hypothetical protein